VNGAMGVGRSAPPNPDDAAAFPYPSRESCKARVASAAWDSHDCRAPEYLLPCFAYYIAPSRFIPGAPWFLSAILLLAALGLAWVVCAEGREEQRERTLIPR